MKNKHAIITAIFLLFGSLNLLALAFVYYKLEDDVINYRYSDVEEYGSIQEGLDFLKKLPIQFNITNEFFSDFDNLSSDTRQTIIMAYALKNNFNTYLCGNNSLCIKKESLEDNILLEKFNSKTKFTKDTIKVYIDDYGVYTISSSKSSTYYKVSLDSDNTNYRKYSKFSHYKEDKDMYIFYLYEGYYNGNCKKGEELSLYDFITGKVVYTDKCNGNNEFSIDPSESIKDLQLYKYELKRDENNKYYLKGYNPVSK